jgi:hypothetical protein
MTQSDHSRFRELLRRQQAGSVGPLVRNPSRPSIPTHMSLPQRSPGHRIAAGRPWLNCRKIDLALPTTAGKAAQIQPALNQAGPATPDRRHSPPEDRP